MSHLNPTLGHNKLAYPAQLYDGSQAHRHPSAPLIAGRDMLIAVALSLLVITGVNLDRQRHSSAVFNSPTAASQSFKTSPAGGSTSQPAAAAVEPAQPDSAALQAVLDKWQADYPNAKFGAVVRELDGAKRSASLNPDTPFDGASLYKLYLADYLYTNIAEQNLSPSDYLGSTHTIGDCLNLIIVYSDNECGDAMGYAIGWGNLQNFIRNSGFSETTETPYNTTTASDMASFLEKLQDGALLNNDSTSALLANMRKQIYRSAIPAGVPSEVVADKVGYIDNYWHDAAIVYGQHSPYILVVLSQDSGSAPIKDLAGRVDAFMNQ